MVSIILKMNVCETRNRDDADEKGDVMQKQKFPQKVMVWLGACSQGYRILSDLG